MAQKDQIDQDALAAEWGLALDADAAAALASAAATPTSAQSPNGEQASGQWAAMVEDNSKFVQGNKGGTERVLSQDEIDTLLGFSPAEVSLNDNSGIRAIIDSALAADL